MKPRRRNETVASKTENGENGLSSTAMSWGERDRIELLQAEIVELERGVARLNDERWALGVDPRLNKRDAPRLLVT